MVYWLCCLVEAPKRVLHGRVCGRAVKGVDGTFIDFLASYKMLKCSSCRVFIRPFAVLADLDRVACGWGKSFTSISN